MSSATVRNILARLEEEGFVQQPHTSAGRIPTDRGYRFYVDLLLESKRSARTAERGRSAAAPRRRRAPLVDSVLSQASHVVSQASRHVGVRAAPGARSGGLRSRRVHPAQRRARARRHRRARRARHPEGHRHRRAARRRRSAPGGQLPERRVLRPAAPPRARSGPRAHAAKSGCSTTR